MKIELGKRYKRRDGRVTGPMEYTNWPFWDPRFSNEYSTSGMYYKEEDIVDLIEEYVEPVVVWCVLDNTGEIVKAMVKGLSDKRYLEQEWPGCKIIKLREVTDEI